VPAERLSALDASFLAVEGPTAHMHVGWAATFAPPTDGPRPDFETLFHHIAGRLGRAPRYRQRIAPDPLGLHAPLWVDAEDFDPRRHVHRSAALDLAELADAVLSEPLARDRPLWELWIADHLRDGRIGLVGKAHHCMVDGIAAVELGSLLLDTDPEPPPPDEDTWLPAPVPPALELLARGAYDRAREQLGLLKLPLQLARSPLALPAAGWRGARAVARTVLPVAPSSSLNGPSSAARHLATLRRPLAELREVCRAHEVTVNDVVLAAVAGALRRHAERRGELPRDLKAMVPVNVRTDDAGELGNRITFIFIELPSTIEDPLNRLFHVNDATRTGKESGLPEDADAALQALAFVPRPVQKVAAHALAGPRVYNLVVSNIPGPRRPMYLHGCPLHEAYPVVPLSDRHALSVGMTTIGDHACFGLHADPGQLPDADLLAGDLDAAIDELRATMRPWQTPPRPGSGSATRFRRSPSPTPTA